MSNLKWTIGDVRITRILEKEGSLPINGLLPAATKKAIAVHKEWLKPYFLDDSGNCKFSIQSLLIESMGASSDYWNTLPSTLCRSSCDGWTKNTLQFMLDFFCAVNHTALRYPKGDPNKYQGNLASERRKNGERHDESSGLDW